MIRSTCVALAAAAFLSAFATTGASARGLHASFGNNPMGGHLPLPVQPRPPRQPPMRVTGCGPGKGHNCGHPLRHQTVNPTVYGPNVPNAYGPR